MKTQTYLHISAPCNEDWNKMTDSEKGRFCQACASQVVDFTIMTDQQVLGYLAGARGKVCGRFNMDQLDRGLNGNVTKRKKIWQWALTGFTSLFFASRSMAQTKVDKQLSQTALLANNQRLNLSLNEPDMSFITIKGRVMDDANARLANASIVDPQTMNKVYTNKQGNFVMQLPSEVSSVLVHANGLDSRVVPVSMLQGSDTTIVLSKSDTTDNGGLQGFDKNALNTPVIMGGITNYTEVEKPTPVTTFIKKVFNNAFFKIQPNPTANGRLGLSVKQSGTYTVQIFDNNSKLVHVTEITINDKGQVVYVQLPTCIVKGVYYVRLIDQKSKKEYVDKMVAQ